MKPLEPPIFIWDPNDLSAFESAEAAGKYLEAVDVETGVYKAAYDAQGRLLKLLTVKNDRPLMGGKVVRVEAAEEEPTHGADLDEILRKFITVVGGYSEEWLSTRTRTQLVETAAALAKPK